ncbi:VWA domain-containing protein [Verrucomicrobia bacterium]|jgi:Ca-activated chloride channel homolog|nr:VWA domain-containing protein [Verrucomicrobiota bacterium]MDA7866658.1 VWA domain-containing protein [Verrucomicrobiota bacterium]
MNFTIPSFVHPYLLLLLLLLPLLAWLRGRSGRGAAFLYSSVALVKGITDLRKSSSGLWGAKLRWLALALCIIALARPRLGEGETAITASGIDIVVAVDLSGSMAAEDFTILGSRVNRLAAAKNVLEEFVDKRRNDRIGLVAFAGRAYIAAPLTLDHDFLLQNLERLNLGTIEDGTAIGSAMTAGLNRLRDLDSKSRIMILMTDGQNNAGKVPPLTAAEAAESLAVKIYTIGVGKHGLAPFPRKGPFGQTVYAQMEVDIDEDTLTKIAETTGGKYYRADSTGTLIEIYDEIDLLEKSEVEVTEYQNYDEIFHWFLLPGLVILLLEIILNNTVWRRLP